MKVIALVSLAAAAALVMSAARADDFSGAYVQLDGGVSHTKATGAYQADKKDVGSTGVEAGYLWNVGHNVLVGVDGFYVIDGAGRIHPLRKRYRQRLRRILHRAPPLPPAEPHELQDE